MDARQLHDLGRKAPKLGKYSRKKVEALLAKKSRKPSTPAQSSGCDPMAAILRKAPGLTAEKAAEMAESYGF